MLVMTAIVMTILYLGMISWTCVNIKVYLVDQRRYKTFSVLVFYIITIVVEISRILMYINVIMLLIWKNKISPAFVDLYVYNVCYVVALFSKIIMGFFQVQSMAEVIVKLEAKNEARAQIISRIIMASVVFINTTLLICMIVEAIYFVKALNNVYYCKDS